MYYKIMKDNKVIDVLDQLVYLKYQPKHKIMVLTDENEAQAILSSDKNTIWHEKTLYRVPDDAGKYDSVEAIEIDEYEYRQLKVLNMKSPEEIVDALLVELLNKGVI